MNPTPALKNRLAALAGALAALVVGWHLGQESYFLPALALAAAAAFALTAVTRVALDVAVVGLLLFGYIVGNRGFAQQLLTPGFPLLPAEAGLAVGAVWLLVRCGRERRLPWADDALNFALLAWIAVSSVRLFFDLPAYGILAARDFAAVYYALFFFVVQRQAERAAHRRFLTRCLVVGVAVLLPAALVNRLWPDFFDEHFLLRGIPVIYYKNDLVQTILAMGSIVLFHAGNGSRWRPAARVLALLLAASVVLDNSRAAIVGLAFACALLLASRNFAYVRALALAGGLALLASVAFIWMGGRSWRQSQLVLAAERVGSIFDTSGAQWYSNPALADKADNNRFREVWWSTVISETWRNAPLLGLGFGYDLSRTFVHHFENDLGDDFSARSPHNFLLTIFGRSGLAGLLCWFAVGSLWLRRTWQLLRRRDPADDEARGIAAASWVILVSACFGVVLEGPMAALPFWIMLGLCAQDAPDDAGAPVEETPRCEDADPVPTRQAGAIESLGD